MDNLEQLPQEAIENEIRESLLIFLKENKEELDLKISVSLNVKIEKNYKEKTKN